MDELTNENVVSGPMCSKCDEKPAGPGRILCFSCFESISAQKLPAP